MVLHAPLSSLHRAHSLKNSTSDLQLSTSSHDVPASSYISNVSASLEHSGGIPDFAGFDTFEKALFFPSRPYQCIGCDKSFARKGDRDRHAKIHKPNSRTFSCLVPGCSLNGRKTFNRHDKLISHQRNVHDLQPANNLLTKKELNADSSASSHLFFGVEDIDPIYTGNLGVSGLAFPNHSLLGETMKTPSEPDPDPDPEPDSPVELDSRSIQERYGGHPAASEAHSHEIYEKEADVPNPSIEDALRRGRRISVNMYSSDLTSVNTEYSHPYTISARVNVGGFSEGHRTLEILDQNHGTLGPVPSLTADLSSRDGESLPCYDAAPDEGHETFSAKLTEKPEESQSMSIQPIDYSKNQESDIGVSANLDISHDQTHRSWPQFDRADSGKDDDGSSAETDLEDMESLWISDYSEGTTPLDEETSIASHIRKVLVELLLSTFQRWFQAHAPSCRRNGTKPPDSESVVTTTKEQDNRVPSQERGRSLKDKKRAADDCLQVVQKGVRAPKWEKKRRILLACPFQKKDPVRYRACYRQTLTKISYVKQHLSRSHRLPIYCPVCMGLFDNEESRDIHTRTRSCEERPMVQWEGVSQAQKDQLQKRVPKNMSEEEQWYTIFDILFPTQPRPKSPYVDSELSEVLSEFMDFATNQGPTILVGRLRASGYTLDIRSQEPELMAALETVLADGLQTLAEGWVEARRSQFKAERMLAHLRLLKTAQTAMMAGLLVKPSLKGMISFSHP